MTPDQYHERVRATLDAMRTPEKDRLLLGLIEQLYPSGDPDHLVNVIDFAAEAVRLLTAFHPDHLRFPEKQAAARDDPSAEEF